MTGRDVLPEKELLEKPATMEIFKYSPLGKELKAQTDIAKKLSKLDSTYGSAKIFNKENYSKSNLIYDANHSFYKYFCDNKKFDNLSLKSKYSFLDKCFNDLN